jgi:group I intron endonuclease
MNDCGIYQLRNILNNKVYIGQSVNTGVRMVAHFSLLKRNLHHNPHLQSAYNKYGKDSFERSILEVVPIEYLTEREQYWLDIKKAYDKEYGYNMGICADSSQRGRKYSEERRKKGWQKGKTMEYRKEIFERA